MCQVVESGKYSGKAAKKLEIKKNIHVYIAEKKSEAEFSQVKNKKMFATHALERQHLTVIFDNCIKWKSGERRGKLTRIVCLQHLLIRAKRREALEAFRLIFRIRKRERQPFSLWPP